MDNTLKNKLSFLIGAKQVVIVCIGTDLLSGDCLGPLVGQMLIENKAPCFVYGTLKFPITALNVNKVNEFIRQKHKGQIVLAIDSAVGDKVGNIRINKGAIEPGSALNKGLTPIGDVSITVTTSNVLPNEEGFSLVPLGFVYLAAKKIADAIMWVLSTNKTSIVYNMQIGL
ncbi:MAG: spore protease YyaC [Firmicutes bacterium]|nr:spore protease YyaC [Bacillota bacterium]